MIKKTALLMAGAAALVFSASTFADVHGRTISATCLSCHGPGGKSGGAIPSLAGLEKSYFIKQMQDFKSGARPASIMKMQATGYTDAEYAAMADYFASLK
jgi:cytochrome c553